MNHRDIEIMTEKDGSRDNDMIIGCREYQVVILWRSNYCSI